MAPETEQDLELLRDAAREVSEREEAKKPKRGGRYVQSAFPGGPQPTGALRFKPPRIYADRLSTKAGPGPQGPDINELIIWARQRRRMDNV